MNVPQVSVKMPNNISFQNHQIRRTAWLTPVRERLAEQWCFATNHPKVKPNSPDWAQVLQDSCEFTKGHLSLPCAIRGQANQIGQFLLSPGFDNSPEFSFRMLLFLLSEYVGQLKDAAGLLDFKLNSTPKTLSVWGNCWAKHNLSILIQHHPHLVFADQLGANWHDVAVDPSVLICKTDNGKVKKPLIIDTAWLCTNSNCTADLDPNVPNPPIVLVPPLSNFIQETIDYFKHFVEELLSEPCRIQMFESDHHEMNRVYLQRDGNDMVV